MTKTISFKLAEKIFTSKHTFSLTQGSPTHDDMRDLIASTLPYNQDEDFFAKLFTSLVPENYKGDTLAQIPGMVKSGLKKGFDKNSRAYSYDPGTVGPIPMGSSEDGRFVFFDQSCHLLHLETSSRLITFGTLLNMAPADYWLTTFPKLKDGQPVGVNALIAGSTLMDECRNLGGFDVSKVRGRGVYLDKDKVVVNFGGALPEGLKYTYICPLPIDVTSNGDVDFDAAGVLETFRLFNWANPSAAMLLFGWTALAPICGVLDWRPHCFLTGSKNTGKTTLINCLGHLLGSTAIILDGTSSEAGIRQKIGPDSRPVILDEFEADSNVYRMKSVVKLARSASSASGQIARGTPEGKALEFNIHSTFMFGAITPMAITAADRSRIVILTIEKHQSDPKMAERIAQGIEKLTDIAPQWCGAAISQIENIRASIVVLRRVFPACESRHALNISTLLAGVWCMLKRTAITEDQARALIFEHSDLIGDLEEAHHGDDAEDCLKALLEFRTGSNMLLGNLLALLKREQFSQHDDRAALVRKVAGYGIREHEGGFLIANAHRGLSEVFRGTVWEAGGWNASLRRLLGVEKTKQKRFGEKRVEAVWLPSTLVPEDYEDGATLNIHQF